LSVCGQYRIHGIITDETKQPVPGATISVLESPRGAISGEKGSFNIAFRHPDSATVVISAIGFVSDTIRMQAQKSPPQLLVILYQDKILLNNITISAGGFDVSDFKKARMLSTMDILTTPGTEGDLFAVLNLLPGSQVIGEQEGLFVRGGSNLETKTYIDGMLAPHPFLSGLPNIRQKSRYSPYLFKGIYFSTGGYSAPYGNALSSVLLLESIDLPDSTITRFDISLNSIGAVHNHRWDKTSVGVSVEYVNQSFMNSLNNSRPDWKLDPKHGGIDLFLRHVNSKKGLFKFYSYYDQYHSIILYPDLNDPSPLPKKLTYDLLNNNLYTLATYRQPITPTWSFFAGTSYSYNDDLLRLHKNAEPGKGINHLAQARMVLTHYLHSNSEVRAGFESNYLGIINSNKEVQNNRNGFYTAPYVETVLRFRNNFISQLGLRADYSSILNNFKVSPRASLAYKTGTYSQVSFAYGMYYQIPEEDYILNYTALDMEPLNFEKSTHYIVNFQYAGKKRLFRTEAYYKFYDDLLEYEIADTNNNGFGFARGIELFWRDSKSLRGLDYWIGYTFLDTKRKYLDYPVEATPPFASSNTMSIVAKYLIMPIDLIVGGSFVFATGRSYYNPNNAVFLGERTPAYKNFSANLNYHFSIGNYLALISLNVQNVFGFENVFSYQFSEDGSHYDVIKATSKRTVMLSGSIYLGKRYEKKRSWQ
jgi:hypothetical protein